MTTLRDATLDIERGVNDALGDEVTYTPADGPPVTFNAWVDFDTDIGGTTNSQAIVDAITIEVPMDRVAQPSAADRIVIALLPGKTWQMTTRRRGKTGSTWILPLKRVAG